MRKKHLYLRFVCLHDCISDKYQPSVENQIHTGVTEFINSIYLLSTDDIILQVAPPPPTHTSPLILK